MNPLTSNELTLTDELMKGRLKIGSCTKEIKKKKKATVERKKRKGLDTSVVDTVTTGGPTPSGSIESSS